MNHSVSPSQPADYSALIRSSLLKFDQMEARVRELEGAASGKIAVVSMGCRFPGRADDPEGFWRLLLGGTDAVGRVPMDRWDVDEYYDPDKDAPGRMYVREGAFLERVDGFDAGFFGISPREAASMDPQHRLLLEVCWEALERGGYAGPSNNWRGGVFVGIGQNDYGPLRFHSGDLERLNPYDGIGNGFSFAAGRLSYVLGLRGPSMAVDTACSSSLVAVHQACQSLRAAECDFALAGGVHLNLTPDVTVYLSRTHALAPDGRCKAFDAQADGFGRGEGCGVVMLRRLSDAIKDGCPILAVISGSALNHNGHGSGIMVPNEKAQEEVLRMALQKSNAAPGEVSYIEAHGTGTELGDPIEANALNSVFGGDPKRKHPLWIGSVKTNFGHLEAASGIAGLIKVVLSIQNGEIPPHLHFKTPSSLIRWDDVPLRVPITRTSWPAEPGHRIAGVSAFGMSGTNVHVVLEDWVGAKAARTKIGNERSGSPEVLVLSAKTPNAALELGRRYLRHLEAQPELSLADLCYTASTRRSHWMFRAALMASTREEMLERLRTLDESGIGAAGEALKVAFLFSGQASNLFGVGRELFETEPIFKEALEECDKVLTPLLGGSVREAMFALDRGWLERKEWAESALFAVEYALVRLWKTWGIEPSALLGHGVGEFVAACAAGILSLDDGLRLVAIHARLTNALEFEREAASANFGQMRIPLISNLTGRVAGREIGSGAYWANQAQDPQRFSRGVETLRELGCSVFLEIGPRSEFFGSAQGGVSDEASFRWVSSLGGAATESGSMAVALGRLYVAGCAISWTGWHRRTDAARVLFPTYPFQRERYWIDTAPRAAELDDLFYQSEWVAQALFGHGVEFLPGPQDFGERLKRVKKVWLQAPWINAYGSSLQRLEAHAGRVAFRVLRELGWSAEDSNVEPIGRVCARLQVAPGYARLLRRLISISREVAQAEPTADSLLDAEAVELCADPYVGLESKVLMRCAGRLCEVLRGTADPLAVLFPPGDASTSLLYRETPGARLLNQMVRNAIQEAVAKLPRNRGLRILEIGAGSGGTTASVLSVFPPGLVQCVFTDAASVLVSAARERWGNVPLMSFTELDIERDPVSQGFKQADFDIVIAANVLHATADLKRTLANVRSLMKRGALLILVEGTAPSRWIDLTFGMTDGWWRFSDHEIRANHPLLSVTGWRKVLEFAGFGSTAFVTADSQELGVDFPQAVFVSKLSGLESKRPGLSWLIADSQGGSEIAIRLCEEMKRRGESCQIWDGEESPSAVSDGVDGLIDLSGLREATDVNVPNAALGLAVRSLSWIQTKIPRLVFVSPASCRGVAGSVQWGIAKVLDLEQPERRCLRVSLGEGWDMRALVDELLGPSEEREVELRPAERRVARLSRARMNSSEKSFSAGTGSWLITGGLGGLGLLTAEWLADRGANHLVLVGRRPPTEEILERIRQMERKGVQVRVSLGDVSIEADLVRVLEWVDASFPALTGVIHSAGVLDDAILEHQTPERFARVFAPKVTGAWNLHLLTRRHPVKHFVLFSSAAALLGSTGQANHAAANAFLDALAEARRAEGLPGCSINWGAWSEVGAAANLVVSLKNKGVLPITPGLGLAALERVLDSGATQVGVVRLDWPNLPTRNRTSFLERFNVATSDSVRQESFDATTNRLDLTAGTSVERKTALLRHLRLELGRVLGFPVGKALPLKQGFFSLGMDSLSSVEFRNRLEKSLGCSLPATVAFDHPTLEALTGFLMEKVMRDRFSIDDEAPMLPGGEADLTDRELAELLTQAMDE